MITWRGVFFSNPSSYPMEIVVSMQDYIITFLFSIILVVIINIFFSFFRKFYRGCLSESHQLERVWTIVPFILILFILVPSLKSLYLLDTCLFCGSTITAIGHQWYWAYNLTSDARESFDSYMVPTGLENSLRLIDADNRLVVPTGVPVRVSCTSVDVIHSWTVPSTGLKIDAIPGRINQFCFSLKRSGIFFGQCREICGANHSFIPIVLESRPVTDLT